MNIKISNKNELLLALISLAGELNMTTTTKYISEKTFKDSISESKQNKLIKIDKTYQRIRLKKPNGIENLLSLSPELFEHYLVMTNNHKFAQDKNAIANFNCRSNTVIEMFNNNIPIDNITLDYSPNNFGRNKEEVSELDIVLGGVSLYQHDVAPFFADGKISTLLEATKNLPQNRPWFYTAKYIKRTFPNTHRIIVSTSTGMLLNNKGSFAIYYMNDFTKKQSKASETVYANLLNDLYQNAYGEKQKETSAIILIPSKEETSEYLKRKQRFMQGIYNHIHAVPKSTEILSIMTEPNWEAKLQTKLYGSPTTAEGICDGIIDNKICYELLSCEYDKINKARQASELFKGKTIELTCYPWQRKIVEARTKNFACEIKYLNGVE